jgi:hypothetical protein
MTLAKRVAWSPTSNQLASKSIHGVSAGGSESADAGDSTAVISAVSGFGVVAIP